MSRKNYKVVLNSTFCTTDTILNSISNKSYYIDWSAILPNKNFKLTFSFISECAVITVFGSLQLTSIDFLIQAKQISSSQSAI